MNERERKLMFSSDKTEWETPPDLFNTLNEEFHFKLDPAAGHENHLCPRYFTEKDNGLLQDWDENFFLNPPYGRKLTRIWMEKAYRESYSFLVTGVCLIPARTDTVFWHNYCMKAREIRLIKGRVKYLLNGKELDGAPFPSAIVIFDGLQHKSPKVISWNWRKKLCPKP